MVRTESGGSALPRLMSALVSTFKPAAFATSANGVPALSLSSISAALARSRFATWSLRQRVSMLVLDLVERPVALRRDARHLVPDIAALDLQRIVFDADLGGERGVEQALGLRNAAHRLARRVDALAVHLDGAHRKLQIGRGLRQRPADGTLVLELVVERKDLGAGALVREIACGARRALR